MSLGRIRPVCSASDRQGRWFMFAQQLNAGFPENDVNKQNILGDIGVGTSRALITKGSERQFLRYDVAFLGYWTSKSPPTARREANWFRTKRFTPAACYLLMKLKLMSILRSVFERTFEPISKEVNSPDPFPIANAEV